MKNPMDLFVIGYACGMGSNNPGCSIGPIVLQNSNYLAELPIKLQWQAPLYPRNHAKGILAIPIIAEITERLARETYELTANHHQTFLILGGDHTAAIGTWSGVATALGKPPGLIWIDAHLDSHTTATTHSGNVHGMPLAALLGYGDPLLTHVLSSSPKVQPKNVCIIGARSFENEERQFLNDLNVRIFYMNEIKERGLKAVCEEALKIVTKDTDTFGISLDLDAIDPAQSPGVCTPEPDGLDARELSECLKPLANHSQFIGAEIVEFNPNMDIENKTQKIIADLMTAMFTKRSE